MWKFLCECSVVNDKASCVTVSDGTYTTATDLKQLGKFPRNVTRKMVLSFIQLKVKLSQLYSCLSCHVSEMKKTASTRPPQVASGKVHVAFSLSLASGETLMKLMSSLRSQQTQRWRQHASFLGRVDSSAESLIVLQLNVQGLTTAKLDVLEQLASNKATAVVLQEMHNENVTTSTWGRATSGTARPGRHVPVRMGILNRCYAPV